MEIRISLVSTEKHSIRESRCLMGDMYVRERIVPVFSEIGVGDFRVRTDRDNDGTSNIGGRYEKVGQSGIATVKEQEGSQEGARRQVGKKVRL